MKSFVGGMQVTKLRDMRFRKTDLSKTGQLEFDQNMLTLLMAIDENKTLLQVAREIKMDAAVFKEYLLKIHKLGLIEEVKEKVEYIDNDLLDKIRDSLVNLLGPLGEMLMQDAAETIHTGLPYIPKNTIPDFLRAIISEIPGNKQKEQFRRAMEEKVLGFE